MQSVSIVPSSDRALRFLARERPDVAEALVRELVPGLLRDDTTLEQEAVDDPRLDLPPPLDADLVARVGDRELLHVEFQGYRDTGFVDRLFRYHLSLVLRYPERIVTTVAIWLLRPPAAQRIERIRRGRVSVDVASVVLAEVKASRLLASERTACFAPASDAEEWTTDELCTLVAEALGRQGASYSLRYAAVAMAAARGRYDAMIRAMKQVDPPLVIEDLVRFGEDRGYERGLDEGLKRGLDEGLDKGGRLELRRSIVDLLDARGIVVEPEQRARIDAEHDLERLRATLRRAAVAKSAGEVLE